MQKNILYIHGFNSSPEALKAKQAQQYFKVNFPDIRFILSAISQLTE